MSEARHDRFEIDLEEIENQLRRSVESAPPPKNDPLAELARIVGQDDPFRGLFADRPGGGASARAPAGQPERPAAAQAEPAAVPAPELSALRREESTVLHGEPNFDPVSQAYGSLDNALADDDFRPLTPRRSRKRLLGVGALVVVLAVGTAGTLAWRKGSKFVMSSGVPPVIQADNAPLKVAPENPGGMEIPNQNKQIYEKGSTESQSKEGQARLVDRREQPIDVQEAARSLPPAPAPADQPVAPSSATAPAATASSDAARPADAPARPRSALASALGEPRRVRTVSVRPDGTLYDAPPAPAATNPTAALVPAQGTLPPPVQVATIPISIGGVSTPAATPQAPVQQAAPAPVAAAPVDPAPVAASAPSGPAVSVLPPQRPHTTTPAARVANVSPSDQAETAAPVSTATRSYSVQLGYRSSEQDAQKAATQASSKYAGDLGGRTLSVVQAEVNGKTIYRMRVGPMSKDDATNLCNKLKGSGGQCFVALN